MQTRETTMPVTAAVDRTRTAAVVDGTEIPLEPPAEWFTPPPGGIPTDRRLTIDAGGRVYGYIALWNACHVGMEGCVAPPQGSPSDYALAHTGETMTAEGELVATGNIGGSVGHAPEDLTPWDAASWYDNTATQLMRVAYGEDEHGLWYAGALWPHITDQGIAELRASSISGDWRWEAAWRNTDAGGFDYCGAVLVNAPGFPLEAAGGVSTEQGFMQSLAASAKAAGFRGIVATGDTYITTISEDTTMDTTTTETATVTGGGCGCGGGKQTITAGTFNGTVDDLANILVGHILEGLSQAGASDGDGAAPADAAAPVDEVTAAAEGDTAATDAPADGAAPADAAGAFEAVNMKLDEILTVLEELRGATVAGEVEALAARLTRSDT